MIIEFVIPIFLAAFVGTILANLICYFALRDK